MIFLRRLIFRPGILFDEIFSHSNHWKYSDLIYLIGAFLIGLPTAIDINDGWFSDPNLIGFIGLTLFVMALLWILIYVFIWMHLFVGKILRGRAKMKQMITVFAIALIPNLVLLSFHLGYKLATKNLGEAYDPPSILSIIIWIISLRILVVGISKAQQFSYGRAILNIFLIALFIQVGIMLFRY